MTYPEAQASLTASRTKLQGASSRNTALTADISGALSQQDGLFSQIPPQPVGGYVDEPKDEFIEEINAWAELADSIEVRIPA